MQTPIGALTGQAKTVHANLAADPEATKKLEVIASETGLPEVLVAHALRELEAGRLAAESFGGWSVLV
jgi:hypothetical protein